MTQPLIFSTIFVFLSLCSTLSANEKVTLQLKWKHQFQFAGYYAAIEKGYYTHEGLDVELIEGKPGVKEVEEVISGRASFGIGMSDILVNRINGDPVVVIANIFQHSPVILLTTARSGIRNLHDFYGKKMMLAKGYKSAEIQAMFAHEGMDINRLIIVDPSWNLNDLIGRKVDATAAYISSEPYKLKQMNVEHCIIQPITYGIDFYGDNIFTSEQEIKDHPKRVAAFKRASLKGWEYALKNQNEVIDLIIDKYGKNRKELTKEILSNEANEYQKLILPDFVEIGHTNPGRWTHIAETYKELGIIGKEYSLDEFLYKPIPKVFDWHHPIIKWGLLLIFIGVATVIFMVFFNLRLTKEISQRKKAEKSLMENEAKLVVSIKEKEVLLKEIHHRVKNNMQIIQSLLSLQTDTIKEIKYKKLLIDSNNRIKSMSLIHETLYRSKDMTNLDVESYLKEITQHLLRIYQRPEVNVNFNIHIKPDEMDMDLCIACGLILNELVSNALKYAFKSDSIGKITIILKTTDKKQGQLIVTDNGCGLPADLNIEESDSLGLKIVKILSQGQLNGEFSVSEDSGTSFRITFPLPIKY